MSGISRIQDPSTISQPITKPQSSSSTAKGDNPFQPTAEKVDTLVYIENHMLARETADLAGDLVVDAQHSIAKPTTQTVENVIVTAEKVVAAEERVLAMGATAEKFIGSTAKDLVTIPSDTINKKNRLPKALVALEPSAPSSPHSTERPGAAVRSYPTYSKAKIRERLPEVNFIAQVKTMVPTKAVSTMALLVTQKISQDQLGDSGAAVATSWLIGGAVENAISIPVGAVRHQMQIGPAKTFMQGFKQMREKKGVMGLYRSYPLNTLAGSLFNVAMNEISPRLTSAAFKNYPNMPQTANVIIPIGIGAGVSLLMLPLAQPVFNVTFCLNDPNENRTAMQIGKSLVKGGRKVAYKGLGYGAKRIAGVGAVYNITLTGLQKAQENLKQKHVDQITGFLNNPVEDLLTGAAGTAESWKVVKAGSRKAFETINDFPVEDQLTGGIGTLQSWKGLPRLAPPTVEPDHTKRATQLLSSID